jgi:hypothetical protein
MKELIILFLSMANIVTLIMLYIAITELIRLHKKTRREKWN